MEIVFKIYKGETEIHEETISDFISRTEGSGYYKKGTAIKVLEQDGTLITDFAIYFPTLQMAHFYLNF